MLAEQNLCAGELLPKHQSGALLTGADCTSCGGSGCAGTEGAVVKVLDRLQLPTPRGLKHCSNKNNAHRSEACPALCQHLSAERPLSAEHAARCAAGIRQDTSWHCAQLTGAAGTHPDPEGVLLSWPQWLECEVCAVFGTLRTLTKALVDDAEALMMQHSQQPYTTSDVRLCAGSAIVALCRAGQSARCCA